MENYSLQFVSDIHLENNPKRPYSSIIQPSAPDLAICGDLGNPYSFEYADFLSWCSKRWVRVFLITGNHEYFVKSADPNKTVEKVDIHIANLCRAIGPNIYFLQKSVFLIEESRVAIIGTTLWAAPDLRHWDQLSTGVIGDIGLRGEYNSIFKLDENTNAMRPYHPSDITSLHVEQKAFLKQQLGPFNSKIPQDYRVIVLTHHMPTFSLVDPKYVNSPVKSTYASDQDALMKEPVVAWICGHSHDPMTLRYDTGTMVTLNPFGYKNQDKKHFSRSATVVVHMDNFATRVT